MKLVQLCLVIGQARWWAPDPCWAIGFWANWFLGGHPVKRSGKLIDKPAQQHLRALLMHQLRVMRPSTRLQLGFQENLNIVDTTIDELRGGMQTGNQTYTTQITDVTAAVQYHSSSVCQAQTNPRGQVIPD
jgi:hypothetical protein